MNGVGCAVLFRLTAAPWGRLCWPRQGDLSDLEVVGDMLNERFVVWRVRSGQHNIPRNSNWLIELSFAKVDEVRIRINDLDSKYFPCLEMRQR